MKVAAMKVAAMKVAVMKRLKWVLASVICLSMFVQGLYFNEQILAALALACSGLIYTIVKYKQFKLPKDPVLYFLLFYLLSHLVGYSSFVEKGMLIYGVGRSLLYLIVYLLVYQISDEDFLLKFKYAYMFVMFVGGLISTIAYLFNVFQSWSLVIDGRLAGPVQYANTMAILLVVALMFFMSFKMPWFLKLIGGIGFIIPLVLTMSRAGIIIGLFIMIIYMVSSKTPNETFYTFIASMILSVVIAYLMNASVAVERLTGTSLNASEFQTRLLYYKDAWAMIKTQVTGYGPYGYYYAQRAFQTGSTYHTKFVHSGVLQICLDLGFVSGIVTLVFALYCGLVRKYPWTNRLAVITVLLHSLIDVDLSYGFVWLILIVLVQQGNVKHFDIYHLKVKNFGIIQLVVGSIGLLVLGSLFMMFVTMEYDNKDYDKVLTMYPYHTEAMRKSLSMSNDSQLRKDRALVLKERNPYIIEAHEILYNDYVRSGELEKALEESRALVVLNQLQISRYESLAKTLRVTGQYRLEDGDIEKALECFEEIIEMPSLLDRLAKELNTHYNVRHVPYLGMTPAIEKEYAIAQEWIKKINSESLEAVNE